MTRMPCAPAWKVGPSGIDAVHLKHWLTAFREESKQFVEELQTWTMWLANEHPPWSAYCAFMACCLVALDEQPGAWKDCALAFLQEQALTRELKFLAANDSIWTEKPAAKPTRQSVSRQTHQ